MDISSLTPAWSRRRVAATATPDVVLAIGGGDDEEQWVTPAAWALAPGDSKWRRLADLNVSRHGHAAAAVDSGVFVFGGGTVPGLRPFGAVEFRTAWVPRIEGRPRRKRFDHRVAGFVWMNATRSRSCCLLTVREILA